MIRLAFWWFLVLSEATVGSYRVLTGNASTVGPFATFQQCEDVRAELGKVLSAPIKCWSDEVPKP